MCYNKSVVTEDFGVVTTLQVAAFWNITSNSDGTVESVFKCIWEKRICRNRYYGSSWTAVISMFRRLCKIFWQYWFLPFSWHTITLDASWEKEVPCRPWNKNRSAQILLFLNIWNFCEQTGRQWCTLKYYTW